MTPVLQDGWLTGQTDEAAKEEATAAEPIAPVEGSQEDDRELHTSAGMKCRPIPGITFRDVWWASVWPMVLVTLIASAVSAAVTSEGLPRSAIGASVLWATIFANRYVRSPVRRPWNAFIMAVKIAAPAQAALGVGLFVIRSQSPHVDPSFIAILVDAEVAAVIGSAAWAFVIVRKGRQLMRRAEAHEENAKFTATPPAAP